MNTNLPGFTVISLLREELSRKIGKGKSNNQRQITHNASYTLPTKAPRVTTAQTTVTPAATYEAFLAASIFDQAKRKSFLNSSRPSLIADSTAVCTWSLTYSPPVLTTSF